MYEIPRHATSFAVRGDDAPDTIRQSVGSAVPASHNLCKTIIHVNCTRDRLLHRNCANSPFPRVQRRGAAVNWQDRLQRAM